MCRLTHLDVMKKLLALLLLVPALCWGQSYPSPTFNTITLQNSGSTGDVSNTSVTAPGTTTARTLAKMAGDVINVKNYGAVGNTIAHYDGTITSGTSTFTSASASFTSADVGKAIQIDGAAGVNSAPLVTTITGFTNSTTVTIGTNATATTPQYNLPKAQLAVPTIATAGSSGSYIPGETISITGGTNTTQAVEKVASTQVIGITVNAGGTGGINGACKIFGTTGKGAYFSANATISGGALTAIGSIITNGAYTTNPTSLTAEPVGNVCSLTGATVTLQMGVQSVVPNNAGAYTVVPSNPVATGAGSVSGATGATLTMTWNTTGQYFYGNDDTAAWSAAIAAENTACLAGPDATIYAPAGRYYLNGPITQFARYCFGKVAGDGPFKTFVIAGANLTGSVFSWDDAWGNSQTPGTYGFNGRNAAGGSLANLTITGDLNNTNVQNGVTFIDLNDMFTAENVTVQYLTGSAFSLGNTESYETQATVRESKFKDIRIFYVGNSSSPAFLINSMGSTDAANELVFDGLEFFDTGGTSLLIENSVTNGSPVRLIRFYGLRVEETQPGFDAIDIGNATSMGGPIYGIHIYGLEANGVPTGGAALRLTADTAGHAPYDIFADGIMTFGYGQGIAVDAVAPPGARFSVAMSTAGTNFTAGQGSSTSLVTGPIYLDANGYEQNYTTNIASAISQYVRTPGLRYGIFGSASPGGIANSGGNPPALETFVVGNYHDGSYYGGNAPGQQAVDFQVGRYLATQTASGAVSVIGGGANNTASNNITTVSGGNGSTASGFAATVCGGASNVAAGQFSFACGYSNTVNQNYGQARGYQALSANVGQDTFASGDMVNQGDAQTSQYVLFGTGASTSAIRVTGGGTAAGSGNCVNLLNNNSMASLQIDIDALDYTTAGKNASWQGLTGLLYRNSGVAGVSLSIASATPAATFTNGTLTGSSMSITADTTNGCLNISWTPPTSNTDTWHVVARVRTVEAR